MIIDCNVHITSDGKWFGTSIAADTTDLLRQMDESGIDRAVVIPLPGVITNEENMKACSSNTDRLIAGYTFNPAEYSSAVEAGQAYAKDVLSLPFSVVKFHNRFAKYQPDDERFMEVVRVNNAAKHPHVIMICGLLTNRFSLKFVDPTAYFFDLGLTYKNTTFIVAHAAGPYMMQVAETCKDLENVYLDLSFSVTRYRNSGLEKDMSWICEKLDRKILWGSDFPEVEQKKALTDLKEITSHLSKEKFANISGENIKRILQL